MNEMKQAENIKNCGYCQKEIDQKAIKCPYCQSDLVELKKPVLTAILNIIFPGLGYAYKKKWNKAVVGAILGLLSYSVFIIFGLIISFIMFIDSLMNE